VRAAGPLVSTAWLESNLDSPTLRIIDIRGQVLPPGSTPRYLSKEADYRIAHVPGARFLDWTRDIVDATDTVPMQVAPEKAFSESMGRLGIGRDSIVLAYDDYNHIFAGRLSWALRSFWTADGHDGRPRGERSRATPPTAALPRFRHVRGRAFGAPSRKYPERLGVVTCLWSMLAHPTNTPAARAWLGGRGTSPELATFITRASSTRRLDSSDPKESSRTSLRAQA